MPRADRDQAEERLQARFEEARYAEAGQWMLDSIVAEYEADAKPHVLERAETWFHRFTRYQFSLSFQSDTQTGFAAIDNASGQVRALSELSNATRVQLLLSLRLAFALEVERNAEPLPFFLDELLATSDPTRYRAICDALYTFINATGRQVFYLTAQPGERVFWEQQDREPPQFIDLTAPEHHFSLPALDVDPYRIALPSACPLPGSLSVSEYGRVLGVSKLHSGQTVDSIHLFHLVPDRLSQLPPLVDMGVSTFGALGALLAAETEAGLLDDETARFLRARHAVMLAYQEAAHQGRGVVLSRAALAMAPLSDTFHEPVAALCEQLKGDAVALLHAIDRGEISRFQRNSPPRERLADWLITQGFIDPRPVLSLSEVEQRALAAGQVWWGQEGCDVRILRWLVRWWWAQMHAEHNDITPFSVDHETLE